VVSFPFAVAAFAITPRLPSHLIFEHIATFAFCTARLSNPEFFFKVLTFFRSILQLNDDGTAFAQARC